jgi:hypothetical protein
MMRVVGWGRDVDHSGGRSNRYMDGDANMCVRVSVEWGGLT